MAGEAGGATLQIGDDIIQPILQAKINAAIVEALGGQGAMMEQMVTALLTSRRDEHGRPCKKGEYGDKGTVLEQVAHSVVKDALKQALVDYFAARKPEITKQILAAMKKNEALLVEAYFAGLKATAENPYHMTLAFNVKPRER